MKIKRQSPQRLPRVSGFKSSNLSGLARQSVLGVSFPGEGESPTLPLVRLTGAGLCLLLFSNFRFGMAETGSIFYGDRFSFMVMSIVDGGLAAKAGIVAGDIVLSVDGISARSYRNIAILFGPDSIGRGGAVLSLPTAISSRPMTIPGAISISSRPPRVANRAADPVVGCGAFRLGFDGGLGDEVENMSLFAPVVRQVLAQTCSNFMASIAAATSS
jgi:hypothetical protein